MITNKSARTRAHAATVVASRACPCRVQTTSRCEPASGSIGDKMGCVVHPSVADGSTAAARRAPGGETIAKRNVLRLFGADT